MAIRTQKLQSTPQQESYKDQKIKADLDLDAIEAAIVSGEKALFKESLRRIELYEDPHMTVYAEVQVFTRLRGIQSRGYKDFPTLALVMLEYILGRLESEPLEPERWNIAGFLLASLELWNSSEQCFKAVLRLRPEDSSAAKNKRTLKKMRSLRKSTQKIAAETRLHAKEAARRLEQIASRVSLDNIPRQRISLAMIVKNEEEMLPACLESVRGLVDEIVLVDTGSTDRTKEIAQEHGARIVDFPWNGSFSDARNVSLENTKGDWILQLDADERILPEQHSEILEKVQRPYLEGVSFVEHNYTGDIGQAGVITHNPLRLWRNNSVYRFTGIIHEQKNTSMPSFVPGRFMDSELQIIHFGYLKDIQESKDKSRRNMELLLEEAETDPSPFNRYNIGTEYMVLQQFDLALEYFEECWSELEKNRSQNQVGYGRLLAVRRTSAALLSGDPAKALLCSEQGLSYFPNNNDLLVGGATALKEIGNYDKALEKTRVALENGEKSQDGSILGNGSFLARSLIGEIFERQGLPEKAVLVYRESLEKDPGYAGVLGPLARAMFMSGQEPGDVVAELRPWIDSYPTSGRLLVAHFLYERGAIDTAQALYREVLESLPEDQIARVGLVETLISQGELEKALQLSSDLDLKPSTAAVALMRSAVVCAILLDQDDLAAEILERAEEIEFNASELELFHLWLSGRRGEEIPGVPASSARAAVPVLETALRLEKLQAAEQLIMMVQSSELQHPEKALLLGPMFARCGYLDFAAQEWLEWIDQSGPTAQALVGLSYIAKAQNREEEALQLAQDAVGLDPENSEAVRMVRIFSPANG